MLEWWRSQESAMALRAVREPCRGHRHSDFELRRWRLTTHHHGTLHGGVLSGSRGSSPSVRPDRPAEDQTARATTRLGDDGTLSRVDPKLVQERPGTPTSASSWTHIAT